MSSVSLPSFLFLSFPFSFKPNSADQGDRHCASSRLDPWAADLQTSAAFCFIAEQPE
jgi:hypothetical protein